MNYDLLRAKFSNRRGTSTERLSPVTSVLSKEYQGNTLTQSFDDAAVLIPIYEGPEELEVLLTLRAEHLKHHAGQVSFPGGRKEASDGDLEMTAIRETTEETGIAGEMIEIIGHLPRMYTISYFDVDPVVSLLKPGFKLMPDPSEVKAIFSVPLSYFADANNQVWVTRDVMGKDLPMAEFHYDGQRIWGATAVMILALMEVLWESGESSISVETDGHE